MMRRQRARTSLRKWAYSIILSLCIVLCFFSVSVVLAIRSYSSNYVVFYDIGLYSVENENGDPGVESKLHVSQHSESER